MEIEIKFHLPDLTAIRETLLASGARSIGRHFENNLRFDDIHGSLVGSGRLLRLRQDTVATLTVKRPPRQPVPSEFKIMEEIETRVEDFENTRAILEELGYRLVQRYEKYRETLIGADKTLFCLDTMPFGHFLEIEGSPQTIRRWVTDLGLDWNRRILASYLAIFEAIRRRGGLAFKEVTFENFKGVTVAADWIASMAAAP